MADLIINPNFHKQTLDFVIGLLNSPQKSMVSVIPSLRSRTGFEHSERSQHFAIKRFFAPLRMTDCQWSADLPQNVLRSY